MQQFPPTTAKDSWSARLLQYLLPSLLLCGLVFFLWRYFKYYIDPDAISYLNIVDQYVQGNYQHAINAFWSPLGCWGTALIVKATGWELFASAIIFNTVPALGMVIAGQSLFRRFRTDHWERFCFGIMSSLFWSYTVYYQSFTDIWQFFFLTIGLLILLHQHFTQRPLLWILLGLTGALAYFGKAYSFYFFPLMILIVTALKLQGEDRFSWKKWITICAVAIAVMMAAAFPWLYLIHEKYGFWTSSTAGKLNMSWWLVGTQELKKGITVLVPPVYEGSYFYFEDPYLVQGNFAHFWDSPALFAKQVARTGFNFIGWVTSANRISAFYFVIWLVSILLVVRKSSVLFDTLNKKILVILFLVFPLPYWLLTFDNGRYLWFTIPLCSVLGLVFADHFLASYINKRLQQVFVFFFFLTFIVTPVADMKKMFRVGAEQYKMAEQLKALQIRGSFATNLSYADGNAELTQIAWFAKCPWYCHTLNQFTTAEILKDAARYRVKYYFYFYKGTGDDYQLKDGNGNILTDLTRGTIPGLKVFDIGN